MWEHGLLNRTPELSLLLICSHSEKGSPGHSGEPADETWCGRTLEQQIQNLSLLLVCQRPCKPTLGGCPLEEDAVFRRFLEGYPDGVWGPGCSP